MSDKSSKEVYLGVCKEHKGASKIYKQLISMVYYWPTMEVDATSFAMSDTST